MTRMPALILAAALSLPVAAAAFADRASAALSTAGTTISVDAEDTPATAVREVEGVEDGETELDPFIPDVHASRRDAARAVAEQWARQVVQRRRQPATVRVMCPDDMSVPMLEGLRRKLVGVSVSECDGALCTSERAPADEAWLYVDVSSNSRRGADGTVGTGGTITIRAKGASGDSAMTRFVEKPWLTDFADFTAHTPGRWVVARSDPDRPAGSAAEAAREARVAAVDEVLPLVVARMGHEARVNRGEIHRLLESQLAGDRLVHDRFPQKYERPYGSLYREAVLIDASHSQLDRLAQEMRWSMESRRESRAKGFVSAIAVLLVTYALYRFANAFTRGYFTWSLRTAAAVVAAGAVMLVVAVA